MTDERRGLEIVHGTGYDVGAEDRGKMEKCAPAVASAVDCPESAKAEVKRLRATLERVLDGTIWLEYGWNSQAKAYRYWFVAKGRISRTSYPTRVEAAVAASETLAANEST